MSSQQAKKDNFLKRMFKKPASLRSHKNHAHNKYYHDESQIKNIPIVLHFRLTKDTQHGEEVYICGTLPQLGSSNQEHSAKMIKRPDGIWTFDLPVSTSYLEQQKNQLLGHFEGNPYGNFFTFNYLVKCHEDGKIVTKYEGIPRRGVSKANIVNHQTNEILSEVILSHVWESSKEVLPAQEPVLVPVEQNRSIGKEEIRSVSPSMDRRQIIVPEVDNSELPAPALPLAPALPAKKFDEKTAKRMSIILRSSSPCLTPVMSPQCDAPRASFPKVQRSSSYGNFMSPKSELLHQNSPILKKGVIRSSANNKLFGWYKFSPKVKRVLEVTEEEEKPQENIISVVSEEPIEYVSVPEFEKIAQIPSFSTYNAISQESTPILPELEAPEEWVLERDITGLKEELDEEFMALKEIENTESQLEAKLEQEVTKLQQLEQEIDQILGDIEEKQVFDLGEVKMFERLVESIPLLEDEEDQLQDQEDEDDEEYFLEQNTPLISSSVLEIPIQETVHDDLAKNMETVMKSEVVESLPIAPITPNVQPVESLLSSSELASLEERERELRMSQGANPILLGKVHQINQEIKSQSSQAGRASVIASPTVGRSTLREEKKEMKEVVEEVRSSFLPITASSSFPLISAANSVQTVIETDQFSKLRGYIPNYGIAILLFLMVVISSMYFPESLLAEPAFSATSGAMTVSNHQSSVQIYRDEL